MSNRKLTDTSLAAKHRAAYEQQIAILLDNSLSEEEKVEKFAIAAGFSRYCREKALHDLKKYKSAIQAVWFRGSPQLSLFADLPGCWCPVFERCMRSGGEWDYIPKYASSLQHATERTLRAFANIQMEERLWEMLVERNEALNEVIEAIKKLPADGWSDGPYLLERCIKATRFPEE
jgi:hypothetical protein